jgi:Integrase core domain.
VAYFAPYKDIYLNKFSISDIAELEFSDTLDSYKIVTRSMSRKGNCWDNAVAESFFKTLKSEP